MPRTLSIAAALFAVCLAVPVSAQLVVKQGDEIRVNTPDIPAAYVNQWTKAQEDAYWQRAQVLLKPHVGKIRTDVTGEHEKWSIPQTLLAYLAGAGDEKALRALEQPGGDGDHGHTAGMDFYWSFTLKGQPRKYFFLKNELSKDYVSKFYEGAKLWSADDVKPNMELVLALDSPDADVRAHALKLLNEMRSRLTAENAAKATNDAAKAAILAYLESDLAKADFGDDKDKWSAFWQVFSDRGWMVFEEVERLLNPRPHPKYGIGTGPVGATWNPNVRGYWADARNTDNLRGMREVAAYLFAEETGNELTRKLYKEKIRRTAYGFMGVGMGEWDSEGYHGHSFAAYLNLYDFAKDPQVKGYAKAILDYLVACGGVKYFHGAWGGPVKRDYGNVKPFSTAAATFFPYFGQAPADKAHTDLEHAFVFTSSYRPPMAIVKMAEKEHKQPFEMLNTHPEYENWLPGKSEEPSFRETIYFGHTYQIGSLIDGSDGFDTNGFKMVMTNAQGTADYVLAGSGSGKVVRNNTVSTVRGDHFAQYRNLVLMLNDSKPEADFFVMFPKDAKVETQGEVTLIRGHETWIAVRPVNGSAFADKIKPAKADHLTALTTTGKGGPVAGYAMQVGDAQSYGSYEKFKAAVTGAKVQIDGSKVTYTDATGISVAMDVKAGGKLPKVWRNGKEHDWSRHMAVFQPADGGKAPLSLGWKQHTLHAEAGGYTFTGELKDDGTYVTTESGPGIE